MIEPLVLAEECGWLEISSPELSRQWQQRCRKLHLDCFEVQRSADVLELRALLRLTPLKTTEDNIDSWCSSEGWSYTLKETRLCIAGVIDLNLGRLMKSLYELLSYDRARQATLRQLAALPRHEGWLPGEALGFPQTNHRESMVYARVRNDSDC